MRHTNEHTYHPEDAQNRARKDRKEHQEPVRLCRDPKCKAGQTASESQNPRDVKDIGLVARNPYDRSSDGSTDIEKPDDIGGSLFGNADREREIGQREKKRDVA